MQYMLSCFKIISIEVKSAQTIPSKKTRTLLNMYDINTRKQRLMERLNNKNKLMLAEKCADAGSKGRPHSGSKI